MKILTRKHFNLPADPWAKYDLETADQRRVDQMIEAVVNSQSFVSILAPRGSGKSNAVNKALAQYNIKLVDLLRLTRDKLSMGDIETAIIRELSDENPRRSGEARSHQVRRILGEASRQYNVVLHIDDSHVLHGNTLRSLKRLRELSFAGKSPLLGIILVGQFDRTERIAEVGLRSDRLWLEGLTSGEAYLACDSTVGSAFDADALNTICDNNASRNWLDLQRLIDECLLVAQSQGLKRVDTACVELVLGRPAPVLKRKQGRPAATDDQVANFLDTKLRTEGERVAKTG